VKWPHLDIFALCEVLQYNWPQRFLWQTWAFSFIIIAGIVSTLQKVFRNVMSSRKPSILCVMLWLCVYRRRDVSRTAVCIEDPSAVESQRLCPLFGQPDHSTLQRVGYMDRLYGVDYNHQRTGTSVLESVVFLIPHCSFLFELNEAHPGHWTRSTRWRTPVSSTFERTFELVSKKKR